MEAGAVQIKLMADISNVISQMQAAERAVGHTMDGFSYAIMEVQKASRQAQKSMEMLGAVDMNPMVMGVRGVSTETVKMGDEVRKSQGYFAAMGTAAGQMWEFLKAKASATYGVISSVASAAAEEAHSRWNVFLEDTKAKAVLVGAVLSAAFTIAGIGIFYTAYKAITASVGFIGGLITGSSYKSESIDQLIAANKEVKALQESLSSSAQTATATRAAFQVMGVSIEDFGKANTAAISSVRENQDEFKRLGVTYLDTNGKLLDTKDLLPNIKKALDQYTEGWDRNKAAVALGFESYGQVKLALKGQSEQVEIARARLNDYNLGLGDESQAAVKRYQSAMDDFNRETQLMGDGFSRAWSDQIMPILTDFAEFFKDGFPIAVNAFRYSMASITSLFYGLKTVVYMVAESIVGSISAIGIGLGGVASAAGKALTGDFSGAKAELLQGWMDAKARLGLIGDNIVEQARRNAAAMRQAWALDDRADAGAPGSSGPAGKSWKDKPKEVQAVVDEYAKLIEKIREKTAVSNAELTQDAALSEGQKMQIQIMQQIANGRIALTPTQIENIKLTLEEMLAAEGLSEAHKAQVKAIKEAEETYNKYIKSLDDGLGKLQDEIAQQKIHNAEIGLSKEALAELTLARYYDMAASKEREAGMAAENGETKTAIDRLYEQAKALRELGDLKKAGGAKEAMVEEAKKSAAAWDKFYDSVYNGLTDSLFRAFEAGKGFFSTFWNGIKNLFKTTVLKLMVQGVVGGTLGSLGLPASANAGGAQGGISSSMLSSGMDWLTDFGSKAGDSLYKFGEKLYNLSSGSGPLAEFGVTLGANSQSIGQTMGQLGDGLGYLNAAVAISKGKWGEGIGSAVGTYFGGPIGAAIGSKIGSWVDSVLKGGETRSGGSYLMDSNGQAYKSQGPSGGEIAGDAVRTSINQAYTGINSMLKSFGSTSSVTGFTAGLESSKNGKGFQYAGGYVNGKGFGEYLGRDGGQFTMQSQDEATAAKNFNSRLQKSIIQALQTADLDGKMGEWLKTIGDVSTATDAQTAVLLDAAVRYQQFTELVKQTPFDYLSDASVLSADAILVLTGGIESFGQKLGSYWENYYSEAERTAQKTSDVSKELAKVGLTMPATREEFKKLVEAQDRTTAAGANAFATLMNVNQAFAELVPAAQEVQKIDMTKYFGLMKDQASLQVDLLKAQGRESDALALKRSQETAGMTLLEWAAAQANYAIEDQIATLEKQRQVLKDNQGWQDKLDVMTGARTSRQVQQANDLASATDDTTQALIGQYYAQLDAADAANALTKILQDNQAWQDKLDVLTGARTDRQVAQANDLASATDESTKSLIREYYAKLDAADASKALADQTKAYADTATQAYQSALTAQQSYLQGLINFGKSVKDFLRGLDTSVNAGTSPSSRLNAARDQYIADLVGSRAGDADAFSRLTNSAQTYMTAGTEMYASGAQQQAIIAQVKAELGGLAPVMQIDKNLEQLARIEAAINTGSTSQVGKLTTIAANTYGLDELARIRTIVNALDWTPGAKAAESTGIMAALSKQNGWGVGTLSQATGYTTADISALFQMYGITHLPGATAGTTAATTPVTAPAATTPATPVNAGQAIDNLVQSLNWDAAHTNSSLMTMYQASMKNGWTQLMIAAAMGLNVADVNALFDGKGYPRFDVGTNYVPHDMLAQIHEGEAIIPKAYNPAAMPMQQDNGNAALLAELRSLRREVITLQAKVAEGVAVETGLLNHQVAANNESINRIGRVATATEATAKTAALEAARA